MTISMWNLSVPVFERTLSALSAIIEKAEAFARAKKIEDSALLQMRLAPDMFALTRQIQISCDFAKNTVAKLSGVEPVKMEDNETSLDQLRRRIQKTLELIRSADRNAINASADKIITFPIGPTKKAQLPAEDFLVNFAQPNFYFHMTIAYAILRHAGVEIGKVDYLGAISGLKPLD